MGTSPRLLRVHFPRCRASTSSRSRWTTTAWKATTLAASSSRSRTRCRCCSSTVSRPVRLYDRATEYVRTALNPFTTGNPPPDAHVVARPKVITETEFADEGLGDLTPYDCVFLCDMPRFTEAEAHRLLTHVRRGGGVVVSVGDRVDLAAYNDVLFRAAPVYCPLASSRSNPIMKTIRINLWWNRTLEREPAFKAFTDSRPREMLLAAHFRKFLKVEPAVKGDPHTLLSFAPVLSPGKNPDGKLKTGRPSGGPALLNGNRRPARTPLIASTCAAASSW